MGTIIYGMMQSLDGYIAGTEGGPQLPMPQHELHQHFNEQMKKLSMELYGRRMYEVMRFWEDYDRQPGASGIGIDFARAWQATPKVVFSTTLREVGPNTRLIHGDVEGAVRSIKSEIDGEISVSGAGLAVSLGRLGLIDEYRLYVVPVVLGGGKPFFEAGLPLTLKPLGTEQLPQGVVLLRYALAG